MHCYKDYLTQPGCPARGPWHAAICTLGRSIFTQGVVDSGALIDLMVGDKKISLKGVPGRGLEQADAMEMRDALVGKLVEEVSPSGLAGCARARLCSP